MNREAHNLFRLGLAYREIPKLVSEILASLLKMYRYRVMNLCFYSVFLKKTGKLIPFLRPYYINMKNMFYIFFFVGVEINSEMPPSLSLYLRAFSIRSCVTESSFFITRFATIA